MKSIFRFRLYVAGDAQNSLRALGNLRSLCDEYLPKQHEIEIVDVFEQPRRALAEGVFMTPALLKLSPGPSRRLIGTLGETESVLQVLGLPALAA